MRCVTISGIGSGDLPGREGHVGGTAADNRLFVEAVRFDFAPASLGAYCPRAFATGDRRSAFNRWAKNGVFERAFRLLASDHDNEYMMIDATIVRAHQHSAGAEKNTARKPSADPACTLTWRFTRSSTPLAILSR